MPSQGAAVLGEEIGVARSVLLEQPCPSPSTSVKRNVTVPVGSSGRSHDRDHSIGDDSEAGGGLTPPYVEVSPGCRSVSSSSRVHRLCLLSCVACLHDAPRAREAAEPPLRTHEERDGLPCVPARRGQARPTAPPAVATRPETARRSCTRHCCRPARRARPSRGRRGPAGRSTGRGARGGGGTRSRADGRAHARALWNTSRCARAAFSQTRPKWACSGAQELLRATSYWSLVASPPSGVSSHRK